MAARVVCWGEDIQADRCQIPWGFQDKKITDTSNRYLATKYIIYKFIWHFKTQWPQLVIHSNAFRYIACNIEILCCLLPIYIHIYMGYAIYMIHICIQMYTFKYVEFVITTHEHNFFVIYQTLLIAESDFGTTVCYRHRLAYLYIWWFNHQTYILNKNWLCYPKLIYHC